MEQLLFKLMEGVTLYYKSHCEILLKERKITLVLKYNFSTQNAKIIKINHILIMVFCWNKPLHVFVLQNTNI
jgi:hypothetical protein